MYFKEQMTLLSNVLKRSSLNEAPWLEPGIQDGGRTSCSKKEVLKGRRGKITTLERDRELLADRGMKRSIFRKISRKQKRSF